MSERICFICESKEFRLTFKQMEDYEYRTPYTPNLFQCTVCGLLVQVPIPSYSQLAHFYPEDYLIHNQSLKGGSSPLLAYLKKQLYSSRAKRVVSHIGTNGNILDVGCANASFLLSVKELGLFGLYGLDIKNTGVDFRKHGIHFAEGCFEEIDYPPSFFDAVVLDNVLEHVPDPGFFMKKVAHVTKPGGFVFGTTPNLRSLDAMLFGRYWGGFHMPRHIYLFNSANLSLFLRRMGFDHIRLPLTPNPANWAVSVQNWLRRNQRKRARYRRGFYFPLLGVLFGPLSLLTSTLDANGVMDFICRKPA